MKILGKILLLGLFSSATFATNYLDENFVSKDGFSTSVPFFSDSDTSSGYDFFGISNGNGDGDFGEANVSKTKVKKYTGFTTNFLTGMDLDGESASLPITIQWNDIDISGAQKLYFSGKFAEFIDSKLKIDEADYIKVEAKVDSGSWKTLLEFKGDKEYNGYFDLNGVKLGSNAQLFQATLPEVGSSLGLKISISVDSGDEDFAISELKISDVAISNCGGTEVGTPASCEENDNNEDDNSEDTRTFIHQIQGDSLSSPLEGTKVNIQGVVTSVLPNLKGFYIQETDESADFDENTSEGIFVYCNSTSCEVNVADEVKLSGIVAEFYNNTQIKNISNLKVISSNNELPSAKVVNLPVETLDIWEKLEGMRVSIPQSLTVTNTYDLGRYGELLLSSMDRIYQFTHDNEPSTQGYKAYQEKVAKNTIILEDGSTKKNPDTVIFPNPALSNENVLRAGDITTNLEGVVNYSYGNYKIIPTKEVDFTKENPRVGLEYIDGNLKVASFNVLNFFLSIDDGTAKCGANQNMDCRGADTQEELKRQTQKLVSALAKMDADIVGLNELENTKDVEVLKYLIKNLNEKVGEGVYSYIDTGLIGDDAIKVGFIYKTSSVKPVKKFAILDNSIDENFIDTKNRPSLAQTFEEKASGEKLTVIVNHLKSKGSPCDDVGDVDATDGQDSCVKTRTKAVNAIVDWIKTDPTKSKDKDFIILGDLNSYAKETPITTLEENGFTNLIAEYLGNEAYSYSYKGQWGYLDYAFSNESLTSQISGVTEWHINSDEAAAFDYNDYNQESLYTNSEYRVSDHDPLIVGIDLFTDNTDDGNDDGDDSGDNPDDGNDDGDDSGDNPEEPTSPEDVIKNIVKLFESFLNFLTKIFSFFF